MIPAGAQALANDRGTAPGIHARLGNAEIYVFPGVPHEAYGLFDRHLFPMLQKNAGQGRVILTTKINTFGLGESDVGAKLGPLMDRKRNPTVGTTVAGGLVSVRIRSEFPSRDQAQREMDATITAVEAALGSIVFSRDEVSLQSVVFELLKLRGKTIATAESCTGGLLGKMLTDPAGSSAVYLGGFVTYSNDAKIRDLNVPTEVIAQYGAVSTQTAEAMAAGTLARTGADYALSITGIAGPTGGSEEKPVGSVCFGLAERSVPRVSTLRLILAGDRDMIRDRSAKTALNLLRLRLLGKD
jgi:nicotinamide-nucleotide amidase